MVIHDIFIYAVKYMTQQIYFGLPWERPEKYRGAWRTRLQLKMCQNS